MPLPMPETSSTPAGASHLRRPFAGLAIGCLLLGAVEAWLHSDDFLHRFRAVFAAGRAMDKILTVTDHPPELLVLGNSRVDNGIEPGVMEETLTLDTFNLGVPGADACNLAGIVQRLDKAGVWGGNGVRQALFGLDEGLFQRTSGLGYAVYFDDRSTLLAQGRIREWIGSWVLLYGYNDSLRTLQEPEKFLRFLRAFSGKVESWGGSARASDGFRAADEVANQASDEFGHQPPTNAPPPPDKAQVACLAASLDLLQQRGVQVFAFPTPALDRPSLLSRHAPGWSKNHGAVSALLSARSIALVDPDFSHLRVASNFANPGHLNRLGAGRYSRLLAETMDQTLRLAEHDQQSTEP